MTAPPHFAALWEDFKQLINKVVAEMNRLDEFSNRTGGLECDFTDADAIVVTSQSAPAMSVTITRGAECIDVFSQIAKDADSTAAESRECLALQSDASGTSFRNNAGELLTIDETVYYILRRFLYLGTRT